MKKTTSEKLLGPPLPPGTVATALLLLTTFLYLKNVHIP